MGWEYCEEILPKVSRTFALNINQLEGNTYKAVLLIYLLFRIADTFEDNIYQSEKEKIKALYDFAVIFKRNKNLEERLQLYEPLKFRWKEESIEKSLVENGDEVLKCYFELHSIYRKILDPFIVESLEGMAKFQKRKMRSKSKIFQFEDIKDLENYCYYVASIVGIMLTKIFCQQKRISNLRLELEKYQIQFGLALQFTNIIKDYQKDIKRGWCYIPFSITQKCGINLEKIDNLSGEQRKGILKELIPQVIEYLNSTLKYIKTIPESEKPLRMFCIIPFVLAYHTLFHIVRMKGNKISREQVSDIIAKCNSFAKTNNKLEEDYLIFRLECDRMIES